MICLPGTMVSNVRAFVVVLVLFLLCESASATSRLHTRHGSARPLTPLGRRQFDEGKEQQIQDQSAYDPVGATNEVLQMPNLQDRDYGHTFAHEPHAKADDGNDPTGDSKQVPWLDSSPFLPVPDVEQAQGQPQLAWAKIPGDFNFGPEKPDMGFYIYNGLQINKPDNVVTGADRAVQPLWLSYPANYTNVKRAVIVWPGKPRDSWKYATLMASALTYAYSNDTYKSRGITDGTVLIVAPVVLNQYDKDGGGANGSDNQWAVYRGSNWQMGGSTQLPNMTHKVSMYRSMDLTINWLMNKTEFPSLNKVVVAGHSMGGQATARYAYMKKTKKYDDNLRYWIGNPGSWMWLTKSTDPNGRPTDQSNWSNCTDKVDKWPYGVYNFTNMSYGKDAQQNVTMAIERFRSRRIHYAFGLLDNGAGDGHCQAMAQGFNHLHRGANFVKMLSELPGGFPENHTVTYQAGISHQDYPMMATFESMDFIFGDSPDEVNKRYPDRTSGHKHHNGSHTGDDEGLAEDPHSKVYRIVAWVLIVAFVVVTAIIYGVFSQVFTERSNKWDRDYWEGDSKRRLL